MGELRFRVSLNVSFQLIPVTFVIADLFAVRTNRNEPTEHFDVRQSLLDVNFELPLSFQKLPEAQTDKSIDERYSNQKCKCEEPVCLIKMGKNLERYVGTGLIPYAVVVTCDDLEFVLAGGANSCNMRRVASRRQ